MLQCKKPVGTFVHLSQELQLAKCSTINIVCLFDGA